MIHQPIQAMHKLIGWVLALSVCWGAGATQAASAGKESPSERAARAEALYYQGYELVSLKLSFQHQLTNRHDAEIERGWSIIDQAAALGNAKALRGMGVYWATKRDPQKAKDFYERAIKAGSLAAKYDLYALLEGVSDNVSNELLHASGKPVQTRASRLLLEAAQGGVPAAVRAWCAQNIPRKPYDPQSPIVAQCKEWMERAAAQGDWQSWPKARLVYVKSAQQRVADIYLDGINLVRGGFSEITGSSMFSSLPDDHPFKRCVHALSYYTTRFLYVFNEQLCVPPRDTFPKWRGLGHQFKAPPASAEAESWYQQGLTKLAQQDIEAGAALLKQAADAGHTGAMINLALIHFSTRSLFMKDIIESTDAEYDAWLLIDKAHQLGDLRATYLAAFFKDRGVSNPLRSKPKGQKQGKLFAGSYVEALRYEKEAAERGLARAQYLHGWQLVRDEREQEGWSWLKKAYANGERIAGFDLYRIARYIWQDPVQAMQYLKSTAKEGELGSVELLSNIYRNGELGQKANPALAECLATVVAKHKDLDWEARQDLTLPNLFDDCR